MGLVLRLPGRIAAQSPSVSPKTEQSKLPDSCAVHACHRNQASASSDYGRAGSWHTPCHPEGSAPPAWVACARDASKTRDFNAQQDRSGRAATDRPPLACRTAGLAMALAALPAKAQDTIKVGIL